MRKIIVAIPLVLSLMACGDQAQDFDAAGTFEATEVTVSAQLAGKLKSFTVSEGDLVKANAVRLMPTSCSRKARSWWL